ncbi:hypothetical protein MUP01_09155 [Candidatus Bathyarchaeota archaeon]|nr:hypothetical protein [Candidatus Bathyarchaeota archaeon]
MKKRLAKPFSKQDEKTDIRKLVILPVAVICYLVSIVLPISFVLITHVPLNRESDAAVVNGLITVSAILLGFSAIHGRQNVGTKSIRDALPLAVFFVQVILLVITSFSYFVGYLMLSYPPLSAVVGATTSILVNLSSWILIRVLNLLSDIESEDEEDNANQK